MPNDLIEVIALYSIPTITEILITLTPGLAIRLAYPEPGIWKRKLLVERSGVIFDDEVIAREGGTWYTYYRISNKREYGTAALLTPRGDLVDILPGATGIFRANTNEGVGRVGVITPTTVHFFGIAPGGSTFFGLSSFELPGVISGTAVFFGGETDERKGLVDQMLLTERRTVLSTEDRGMYNIDQTVDVSAGWLTLSRDRTTGHSRPNIVHLRLEKGIPANRRCTDATGEEDPGHPYPRGLILDTHGDCRHLRLSGDISTDVGGWLSTSTLRRTSRAAVRVTGHKYATMGYYTLGVDRKIYSDEVVVYPSLPVVKALENIGGGIIVIY